VNLPSLYARVVAKRPELAVENIGRRGSILRMSADVWLHFGVFAEEETIASLILAKWVEALPVGHWLHHAHRPDLAQPCWRVCITTETQWIYGTFEPTPIEALAAFWMEYQP